VPAVYSGGLRYTCLVSERLPRRVTSRSRRTPRCRSRKCEQSSRRKQQKKQTRCRERTSRSGTSSRRTALRDKRPSLSRKSIKSIRVKGGLLIDGSKDSDMSDVPQLPSFNVLKKVIASNFTLVPPFVPEKESLFIGLDEDREPISDERVNYVWDGKSKLAFFRAKTYSDGTVVGEKDMVMHVASPTAVKCNVYVSKQNWNELGQFRCCFSIKTMFEGRDCLNDNFSAIFMASRNSSSRFEPEVVFVGKYSKEYLRELTDSAIKFISWLNSI